MLDIINQINKCQTTYPDRLAVKHKNDSLTYKALNERSTQLAHMIIESSQPLMVYGHMSPDMITGMIGAIKAGCGYVPVDTSIPKERIQKIIDKAKPQFIFNTSDDTLAGLDLDGVKVLTPHHLEEFDTVPTLESKIQADSIVYTIFTSGSTGEPKGVQIRYDSLLDFTQWMIDLNQLGEGQEWLNQAPFSFDLSVMAIYPCLASGGTLNLVDKEMINKPKLLNKMLQDTPVNIWVSTPSFMEMCLMLPNLDATHYPSLQEFFFCGEVLPHRTAKVLLKKYPESILYNTYGPTEATVAITSIRITQEVLDTYEQLPVGTVKPNNALSLTDQGELVISGKSVSAGYLKDQAKTEQVFDFSDQQRSYYTGDKAKVENDLWFIQGRIDFQIKLNGYRMELEEIEAQLRHLPAIREAVVVPIKKKDKITHLVGVIVPTEEVQDTKEADSQIKHELKSRLPEYMIPRKFVRLTKLPLTQNGKVDRKQIALDVEK